MIEAARVFLAVARRESFSAGATDCGIPQPVASRRIAALEQRLGGALFERTTRRVELTEFGRALLPAAARLVSALHDLDAAAEAGRRAAVVLAVPEAVDPAALAHAVARAAATGLELETVRAGRSERADLLRVGGAAAAIVMTAESPDWSVPLGVAGPELPESTGGFRLSRLRPARGLGTGEWPRAHVQSEDDADAVTGALRREAARVGLSPSQIATTRSTTAAVADALGGASVVICSAAEAEAWRLDWRRLRGLDLARRYRLETHDGAARERILTSCGAELGRALGGRWRHP